LGSESYIKAVAVRQVAHVAEAQGVDRKNFFKIDISEDELMSRFFDAFPARVNCVAVWFAYARKLTRSGHAIYVAPLPAGSIPNSLHFPDPSRPHMIAILLFSATPRIWRRARYSET